MHVYMRTLYPIANMYMYTLIMYACIAKNHEHVQTSHKLLNYLCTKYYNYVLTRQVSTSPLTIVPMQNTVHETMVVL